VEAGGYPAVRPSLKKTLNIKINNEDSLTCGQHATLKRQPITFFSFFFFFGNTGVSPQNLVLARLLFYHLSHTSSSTNDIFQVVLSSFFDCSV
jgi:hypothetical protein